MKVTKKLVKLVSDNAPTILTVTGVIGVVSAVALSSDAALKSKQALEEASKKGEVPTAKKVQIYTVNYIPTIFATAASITCLIGQFCVTKQRLSALAGAYILSERALSEYQDNIKEFIGSKKAQEVKDDIIKQHMIDNPPTKENTVTTTSMDPNQHLWWDEYSGKYFPCTMEKLRLAEIRATEILRDDGEIEMNEIYSILGVPIAGCGDGVGWIYKQGVCEHVSFNLGAARLTDDGLPYGIFDPKPKILSASLYHDQLFL